MMALAVVGDPAKARCWSLSLNNRWHLLADSRSRGVHRYFHSILLLLPLLLLMVMTAVLRKVLPRVSMIFFPLFPVLLGPYPSFTTLEGGAA